MIPFAGGAVPPVHSILCQKRSGLPGAGGGISNKFCPGNLWGQMPLYAVSYTHLHTDEYVALMPLKGPDGEQNALVEGITGFYKGRFMITDKAKNPEILMQWIDRFYENMETGLNATYGIGPDKEKAWYYDDNNNIIFKKDTELPEDQIRGQQQLPFAPAIDVYKRQGGYRT